MAAHAPYAERSLSRMVAALRHGNRPAGLALAACRPGTGVRPDLFYPGTGRAAHAQVKEAKAVCTDCPARAACLAFAMESGDDWGIWGGLTGHERAALRQAAKRAARSA